MQNWKQAFWLAKFELKAAKRAYLMLALILIASLLYLVTDITKYLANDYVGFDIFFIVIFSVASAWVKPNDVAYRKLHGDLWASPAVYMLNQLPIQRDVLIKSRFIIYFCHSIPLHTLILIFMYVLNPELHNIVSLGTYLVFAIIWLSFGIYVGGSIPASEIGSRIKTGSMVIRLIVSFFAGIALFSIIQVIGKYGIVHWTIIFAEKWPILSTVISVLLAIGSLNYYQRYMEKKLTRVDYL